MSAAPTDLSSVARRLEKLERKYRRLRVLAWIAVAGVLLGPWLTVALAPGTLFAERLSLRTYLGDSYIILRDGDGSMLGSLRNDYDGITLIRTDPSRHRRAVLSLGEEEAAITLLDGQSQPLSKWSVSKDGARFEKMNETAKKK